MGSRYSTIEIWYLQQLLVVLLILGNIRGEHQAIPTHFTAWRAAGKGCRACAGRARASVKLMVAGRRSVARLTSCVGVCNSCQQREGRRRRRCKLCFLYLRPVAASDNRTLRSFLSFCGGRLLSFSEGTLS